MKDRLLDCGIGWSHRCSCDNPPLEKSKFQLKFELSTQGTRLFSSWVINPFQTPYPLPCTIHVPCATPTDRLLAAFSSWTDKLKSLGVGHTCGHLPILILNMLVTAPLNSPTSSRQHNKQVSRYHPPHAPYNPTTPPASAHPKILSNLTLMRARILWEHKLKDFQLPYVDSEHRGVKTKPTGTFSVQAHLSWLHRVSSSLKCRL